MVVLVTVMVTKIGRVKTRIDANLRSVQNECERERERERDRETKHVN